MVRHDVSQETLTVLPKRLETALFAWRSFNTNYATVNQGNYSNQVMGFGAFAAQNNLQANEALVIQIN